MNRLLIFFAIGIVETLSLIADDNCARRYAALDRDPVTSQYFLLATSQVQTNLGLTSSQIKSLISVFSSDLTNDPAIAEYRRSHKRLLNASISEDEKVKIRKEGNEKYSRLVNQYMEADLMRILSPIQTSRLAELFIQMRGPDTILQDTNIAAKIRLTNDQVTRLNEASNTYGQLLSLLRQRFLGLQIQTVRKRDPEDVMSEIACVAREMAEVERDRDCGLLSVLSDDQRNSWSNLCGTPLSIDWKVDLFSDFPFQLENKKGDY